MSKIPFYIGNFVACFVPGSDQRAHVRGWINIILYQRKIAKLIHDAYGCRVTGIRFVRQRTLNRMVCVVNDKYYVKIFRDLSPARVCHFADLIRYIRPYISVAIPEIIASHTAPMYVCARVPGHHIEHFSPDTLIAAADKIHAQVAQIITQIQSIDVKKIPNYKQFYTPMQEHRNIKNMPGHRAVLVHFDINETNLMFDDNLNVCALIDWDTISIAANMDVDMNNFMHHWDRHMGYLVKKYR